MFERTRSITVHLFFGKSFQNRFVLLQGRKESGSLCCVPKWNTSMSESLKKGPRRLDQE